MELSSDPTGRGESSSRPSRTSLSVVVFQHAPFEGPAAIETWFSFRGHRVATNRRWLGDKLPDTSSVDVLVVMGGPMSVNDTGRFPWIAPEIAAIRAAIDAGVPVLGICLGAQLIARALGARVRPGREKEIGWWPVEFENRVDAPGWSRFLNALPTRATVMHWHGETYDLPEGATWFAGTPACENQAFLYGRNVAALQFHLESTNASVVDLTRMSGDDIEFGTYQVGRPGAEATMKSGESRYGGAARAILSSLLAHIEREASRRR